jgi:hypothetical protein
MRLLILVDDYMPHTTKIAGKMMHELATELVRRGIAVSVCTPASTKALSGVTCLDGVNVYRFFAGQIKNQPKIVRLINELLLPKRAWRQLRDTAFQASYDGIIFYSPTIFWGTLVRKLKRYWDCQSYLVLRDIFPQWAVDAGIIKDASIAHKFLQFYEGITYAAADCIAVQSPRNMSFAEGCTRRVEVLYNWTLPSKRRRTPWLREKYNLLDKVILFYGGNIGAAQDMSNLVRLAKSLEAVPAAQFVFLGQGDEVELVKRLIAEHSIKNLIIDKAVSQEAYCDALAEVDVGLLSLHSMHKSHNYPGKLLGYLESGLPVLASLNAGNDLITLINQTDSGFAYANGDDEKLAYSASQLVFSQALRKEKGANARRLLDSHFHVSTAADSIVGFFQNSHLNV